METSLKGRGATKATGPDDGKEAAAGADAVFA